MIAVIFEVWPAAGRKDDYLSIAASLRADLDRMLDAALEGLARLRAMQEAALGR